MILIDNLLISDDVMDEQFVCNLSACKGACCVLGDAGAPLETSELPIMEEIYPKVKPYLSQKSRAVIREQGIYIDDTDQKDKRLASKLLVHL